MPSGGAPAMVCDARGWCGQRSFVYEEGSVYCVPPVGSERSSQRLSRQAARMNTHVPSWSQGGRYLAGSMANKGRGRGEGLRASVSILGLQLDAR